MAAAVAVMSVCGPKSKGRILADCMPRPFRMVRGVCYNAAAYAVSDGIFLYFPVRTAYERIFACLYCGCLLVSVITVILCRKFNIPSMLGYLLVGFLAVNSTAQPGSEKPGDGLSGAKSETVNLMLNRGLDSALHKLRAMRRLRVQAEWFAGQRINDAVGNEHTDADGRPVQLGVCRVRRVNDVVHGDYEPEFVEKTELGQPHGQMAMGVLLMQDFAVVPLMILILALAGGGNRNIWAALGLAFAKMLLTMGQLFLVCSKIM